MSREAVPLGRLFLAVFLLYAGLAYGLLDNPDGELTFQTTKSLVEYGRFALSDTPEVRQAVAEAFGVLDGPGHHHYVWFGPIHSLLEAPLYALGKALGTTPAAEEFWERFCVSFLSPLVTAGTVVLLASAVLALGFGARAALLVAVLYGTASLAVPHARSSMVDPLGTFLITLALWAVLRYRAGGHPSHLALTSFGIGAAIGSKVLYGACGPPLVLFALWSCWRRRDLRGLLWHLVPLLAWAAALAWFNVVRFGSPWEVGHSQRTLFKPTFYSLPFFHGVLGFLVSPGRAVWIYTPLLLLVPAGLRALHRRRPAATWAIVGLFLAFFLPLCKLANWHGAWTWGPRFLLPVTPALFLALAPRFEGSRRLRGGVRGLIAASLLVQGAALVTFYRGPIERGVEELRSAYPDEDAEALFNYLQFHPRYFPPWTHTRSFIAQFLGGTEEVLPARSVSCSNPQAPGARPRNPSVGFSQYWPAAFEGLPGAWALWLVQIGLLAAGGWMLRWMLAGRPGGSSRAPPPAPPG